MTSQRMQMVGSALALVGWVGVLLCCSMPMWRVATIMGTNIVTSNIIWEGIWMACVGQSTGHIQCNSYDSMMTLSSDLKAAQVFTVGSILTGALGLILALIGGKCSRFLDYRGEGMKNRVATAGGVLLISAGLLCFISVSWSTGAVVQMFHDPQMTATQHRDIGGAIYVGWGASILLLLGGGVLCATSCPLKAEYEGPSVKYMIVHSSQARTTVGCSQRVWITEPAQNGTLSVSSQRSDRASANHQRDRPISAASRRISASTTKSKLTSEKSMVEYEHSRGLSTKSQMIYTGSDHSSATEIYEPVSTNNEKTYI
ncbi:claudin-4-like [Electrophorus electricus]|uniref:claudin-4-like n=1 Tax=Electrophorus electricus TaxID=8005 RepID=UPI0015D01D46|nr:claudin-4-like [Electrophorus electricus]